MSVNLLITKLTNVTG